MQTVLLIIHVLLAIALIALVLIQHGKGADAGAAFGSGASSTVFGARGASSFLSRSTAILATLFFVVSLALAILANRQTEPSSVTEMAAPATKQEQPAEMPSGGDVPAPAAPSAPAPAGNQGKDVPAPPSQ
jgi:preprotein translocase subunit SecG